MDKQRSALRKCLKEIDEKSLRRICSIAMLTETETTILTRSYSRLHDESYIADELFMSVGNLQKKKKIALKKILSAIGIFRHSSYVSEEEIVHKLGAMLSLT